MTDPKPCDFCGRRAPEIKLSGEHVLRDWLRHAMPEIPGRTTTQWWLDPESGAMHAEHREIPASPFDAKSRRVCRPCNQGWLNEVEQAAEQHLVALIKGEPLVLDEPAQVAVATWAAKTTAVRGRVDKGASAVTDAACHALYERGVPPPGWLVWLGSTDEDAAGAVWDWHKRRSIVYTGLDGAERAEWLHSTVFVLGRALFYVIGYDGAPDLVQALQDDLELWMAQIGQPLEQLWPPLSRPLVAPTGRPHDYPMVLELSQALDGLIQRMVEE